MLSDELEEALSALHRADYAPLSRWPVTLRRGDVVRPGLLGPHEVVKTTGSSVFLEPTVNASTRKRFELAYDAKAQKFQVFKGGRPTLRLDPRAVETS